jgi:hypothetical protein
MELYVKTETSRFFKSIEAVVDAVATRWMFYPG